MSEKRTYLGLLADIRDYLTGLDVVSEEDKALLEHSFDVDFAAFKCMVCNVMFRNRLLLPEDLLEEFKQASRDSDGWWGDYLEVAKLQERNKAALAESA